MKCYLGKKKRDKAETGMWCGSRFLSLYMIFCGTDNGDCPVTDYLEPLKRFAAS